MRASLLPHVQWNEAPRPANRRPGLHWDLSPQPSSATRWLQRAASTSTSPYQDSRRRPRSPAPPRELTQDTGRLPDTAPSAPTALPRSSGHRRSSDRRLEYPSTAPPHLYLSAH